MSDQLLETHLENLWSKNRAAQNEAFYYIIDLANQPVDWAYEVWDTAVENLSHEDNHNRAIAAQLLCNLAKSDPDNRILTDFEALLAVTKDKRFVTARHSLQALWKVGLAGESQQKMALAGLANRFEECLTEKNYTLIRYDISQGLRNLYDAVLDEAIKDKALALIETEADVKYRKKYGTVWRSAPA
jgi:hypothetical protein